ncbi:MAG: alpha/beta hydrolase [Spirochaetota bacterium]
MQHRVRPALRWLAPLLLAGLASGCSVMAGVNFVWNYSRASDQGTRFYQTYDHIAKNVSYADVSDVRLDVYSPPSGKNHPVYIFIHGGGWESFNKTVFAPLAMQLVPEEIVVVIPNYTLHPNASYEQMAREVAAAVAWTLEHANEYRGDPGRVTLSGHSAGGHLSGLVAFDPTYLAEHGYSPSDLCAWVGLSGVYDIELQMAYEHARGRSWPVMRTVMGGEENFAHASPVTHVGSGDTVEHAWLVHGAGDEIIPLSVSEAMADRLERAGVPMELVVYEDSGHNDYLFEGISDPDARVLQLIRRVTQTCYRTNVTDEGASTAEAP